MSQSVEIVYVVSYYTKGVNKKWVKTTRGFRQYVDAVNEVKTLKALAPLYRKVSDVPDVAFIHS
jgi:hypothetical protein